MRLHDCGKGGRVYIQLPKSYADVLNERLQREANQNHILPLPVCLAYPALFQARIMGKVFKASFVLPHSHCERFRSRDIAISVDLEVGGEPSLQINHGAGHGLEAGVLRVQVLTPEMEGSGERHEGMKRAHAHRQEKIKGAPFKKVAEIAVPTMTLHKTIGLLDSFPLSPTV